MAQETETKTREISAEERQASSAKAMEAAKVLSYADEHTEAALAPFASAKAFAIALRMADNLADSSYVPKAFQGKPADLVFAMDIAHRTGMGLLAVLQSTYFVGGKPGFEAKFLIACLNATRRFSTIDYEEGGSGDDQYCIAFATDLKTDKEKRSTRITIKMAKMEGWCDRSGSKWKSMPDQMLRYRSAAFFIRAFAPDVALGMQTVDELHDIGEVQLEKIPAGERTAEDFGVKSKSEAAPAALDKPKPATRSAKPAATAQAPAGETLDQQPEPPPRRTTVVDGATVDKDTGEILSDPKADAKPASIGDAIDRARVAQAELDEARAAADKREQEADQERAQAAAKAKAEREKLESADRAAAAAAAAAKVAAAENPTAEIPSADQITDGMRNMVLRKCDSAGTTIDELEKRLPGGRIRRSNINDAFAMLEHWKA